MFYMSAHVYLNLFNGLGGVKSEVWPRIVSFSPNEFNKFSNTGARTVDFIYHMTLKSHLFRDFCIFIDVNAYQLIKVICIFSPIEDYRLF